MYFVLFGRVVELKLKHILFSLVFLLALFLLWFFDFPVIALYIPAGLVLCYIIFRLFKRIFYSTRLNEFVFIVSYMLSQKKKLLVRSFLYTSLLAVLVFGVILIIPYVSKLDVDLSMPSTNDMPSTKEPVTATPKPVETSTTSTTTTTEKRSGFFVFKKEKEDDSPKDCSFDGRGHDAILMPSGNYYCRSTEKRVTIHVNGVEKICCVG